MLPRKRQRPNPTGESSSSADAPATPRPQVPSTSRPTSRSESVLNEDQQQMPPPNRIQKTHESLQQVRKAQSWYGSWPRIPKVTASTSVARENIFGGSVKPEKAPGLSRFDMKKDSDTNSTQSTARSAAGPSSIPENEMKSMETKANDSGKSDDTTSRDHATSTLGADKPDQRDPSTNTITTTTTPQRPATSSGWLGWWSRTPLTDTQATSTSPPTQKDEPNGDHSAPPSTPPAQTAQGETAPVATPQEPPRSTSWFGFWSSSAANSSTAEPNKDSESASRQVKAPEDVVMEDGPPPPQQKPESAPKAGSTWAFWSKDSPESKGVAPKPEAGEIAVMGEGSEAHPKPMTEGNVTPSKSRKDAQAGERSTWTKSNKRLRPLSMDVDTQSPSPSGSSTPQGKTTSQSQLDSQTQAPAKTDSSGQTIAEPDTAKKTSPNLLLPSFASTYQMKQDPSIIKQIAQFLLRAQQSPVNHAFRVKDPPKIRKAVAIGIHGFFPALYLRPVIGQPTGTSLRFANLGADAIRRWVDAHGSSDCEIEKVALEGEGKVNERVDNLWKLMLNWIEHIRGADLILLACHSQGVPVSIMLLEKLIDLGIITNARIGVCAMAGVSLGPFPSYKSAGSYIGSAGEMWDFANPESTNAQRFEASLKRVLDYGARITFVGSIDDQVVPMESAIYSPANHPYIYRAVFIDGRIHAPDFIAHLVGFALKLRNLGISDHGLIRELSVSLAGSLYTGDGHSRLYYDDQVYDLAISHALETTSAPRTQPPPCTIHHRQGVVPAQHANPYVLPWIMRGLLEEDLVKTELSHETEELLRQFDDWKPSKKELKDVKYRLEAVRSKL